MRTVSLLAALALTAATVVAPTVQAAAPSIAVAGAWARPTPPGATTGAVYLTVTNRAPTADTLVSASTPAAAKVEFHSMAMNGAVMTMRQTTPPIAVAPGGSLRFAPNGSHIMLIGLKAPLRMGAHVPLTLVFSKAGAVKVSAVVQMAPAT